MDLTELERRITRLEDTEAIKRLKARYCEICDDDHDPKRITSVFAEDGVWQGGGMGRAGGGRGGMGGGRTGQQRPDPLKLWTTVTLATAE